MPVNLMLMTPYYQFNFISIPMTYRELQTQYYKKPCVYCKKQRTDSVTCLLCGETMCWYKIKDGQCSGASVAIIGGYREGLICYHTRMHEGGQAAYLHTSTGNFLLVQNGTAAIFETPYRNKYGELISQEEKNWDAFVIDEQGGGLAALQQIQKKYVDF